MRYKVQILGQERVVDISGSTKDYVSESLGRKANLRIVRKDIGYLVIAIDDRLYNVRQLRRTSSLVAFVMNGKLIEARLGGEKSRTTAGSSIASVNELVSSNFPAKVVKIKAKPGDELKEGDTLIILEAMKMEAQIRVPRACRVSEIYVKDGEMVEKGKPMARLSFN